MTENITANPVVASKEHPSSEAVAESPPSSETVTTTAETQTVILRSPSPPTTEEITTDTTAFAQRESPTDPRVVALRAMFPDYDDTILQSILESVDWDQDRAVDTLLIMSDPDYKPEPQPGPQRPQRRHTAPEGLTQEQLDEQFARQLLIQEEEHQRSQWTPNRTQGPGTYSTWGHPGGPAQQTAQYPQQQPGQVGEFQEQFNKFAETGKKTIGSFLSKVKTKFQEFEQGRASGPSTTQSTQYPSHQWTPGPGSYYGPPQSNQPPQGLQYVGQFPSTAPPLPVPHSPSPPPTNQTLTSAPAQTPKTQTNTVVPLTSPATPIDGGKLGLLPKRPISLIRDEKPTVVGKNTSADNSNSTTATPGTTSHGYVVDDDDDGLEYSENPFDEPVHKK